MSYLVLARKYRPQTFSEVIGQEHITRTLQNAIRRGRIHHAFLFCGGRGTGKTTTARILAKALSCEHAPTPDPCNQCEACLEIARGSSVDVQEIDAASQNKVEDIRELREAIRYAPVRGKKKLYILDEVHMLSTSAFNAMLKTLEEPPPHVVFVFATTDPQKLPQTILSRVQRYDFKLVPSVRLGEHLADVLTREGIEFERNALQLIAREGAGSVRDSLSLLDQVLASCQGPLTEELTAAILGVADRGLVLNLGQAVVGRDRARAIEIIDAAYGRGYDLAQLARALLGHLRDLLVVSVVEKPEALLDATSSELDEMRRQATLAEGRIELLFECMMRIADDTARAALPRYVLEVGVVELCRVVPLEPFDELLRRMESLEGRIESGGGGPPRGPGTSGPRAPAPLPASRPAPVQSAPVAPPPAPAPQPGQNGHAAGQHGEQDFAALAQGILRRDPLLHGLAIARPVLWDAGRLVIGFDNPFSAEQMRDKLPQLRRAVVEELGRDIQVEVQVVQASGDVQTAAALRAESLVEAEQRKTSEERTQRRREALGHPARKVLAEAFGDDISFQEPEME